MTLGKGENMKTRISRKIGVFILISSFIISMMLPISVNTVNAEDNTEKFELLGKIFRGTCGCCRDTCTLEFYSYQYNSTQDTCLKVNDGGEITYIYFNYGLWNSNTNTLGIYAGAVTGAWSWYAPLSIRGEWKDGKFNFLISLPNGSNICAGDFDLIYSPPEPEEPEPEEPWVPDGAFSISKSGDWIAGKECDLYGTYSASTPGKAEEEAEEIVWSSSDSSILDVSDTIIDINIADEENNHVSIQKSFTAKKAGTVTITATAPDGRSASVTVDVMDSEKPEDTSTSILDYEKYKAKYYSENILMITGGYMPYSTIEDYYTPTEQAVNNILNFGWTAKFGYIDPAEIWETLLLDILFQRTADVSSSEEWEKDVLKLCDSLYDEAIKNDISDLKANINANIDNVNTLVSEYESLKGISTSNSVLGKLIDAANTVGDFINYYAKYIELRSYIVDDTKAFLNKMQTTTIYNDNHFFKRALDNVIQNLSVDENELAQLLIKETIAETASDKIITAAMNISVKTIVDILIPGASAYFDFTKNATICMMNTILDIDQIAQLNVYLYMLDTIDQAAKEAMRNAAFECLDSNGKNYQVVNGGLQFITDISSYGVSICRHWSSIISTDILTKVSNEFLIASRPHYDIANDYFNLNHPSTIDEKNQYVEELCLDAERYIDTILRSMPGFARMEWFEDSGISEGNNSCLVLFDVLNPETGAETLLASVVPKHSRISFPELGAKSGYVPPTQWYLDVECTQVADSNQLISENTIFYTKWTRSIFYMLTESGGASIVSMGGKAEQKTPFVINTLSKSIKNDPENGIYEIPSYIDGYRVETLGDDIFAGASNVCYVSLPGTLMDISDSAFASVEENATFVYVEGSIAERYILEKNYSNTKSIKELYFKNTPDQMIIGETVQIDIVQEGSCISDDVQWKSSDENVASIEDGKLIANAEGNSIISAQVGGVTAAFEITVTKEEYENPDEHTHSYGVPEFNWSEDYQTCTAVFTCESCDDRQKIECDITSETTEPTCTEDGKKVYTATVTFADKEYTDTQEEVIIATGHTYEYTDNGDGTHTKVCTAGDDTATEPHTYQDGICTYCGAEEPKEHVHEYGIPEFKWSEDYITCTAVFTCKDGDDQQSIECEVTDEVTDPTCTESGKTVYTAAVIFGGTDYTDTKETEIAATGHTYRYTDNGDGTHTKACTFGDDTVTEPHTYQNGICTYCGAEEPQGHVHTYGDPKFRWSEDNKSCTAVFTCIEGDDQQTAECTVTSRDNGDGTVTFTAEVEFNGASYTDTRMVKISEEPDVPGGAEEPEGPVPGDNTSDSNDKPGKPADGTAGAFDNRTDGNVETGVKTGDDNSILLWSMMLAAATIGAGIISFGKKKRAVK